MTIPELPRSEVANAGDSDYKTGESVLEKGQTDHPRVSGQSPSCQQVSVSLIKSNQVRIFNVARITGCHYKVHRSNVDSYNIMSGNDWWNSPTGMSLVCGRNRPRRWMTE